MIVIVTYRIPQLWGGGGRHDSDCHLLYSPAVGGTS